MCPALPVPVPHFRALAAQVLNGAFIKEMSASSLPTEGAAGGVDRQVRNCRYCAQFYGSSPLVCVRPPAAYVQCFVGRRMYRCRASVAVHKHVG